MDAGMVYEDKTISILLIAASLVLLANGIFNVEQFGVQYGLGVGALLQSRATNVSVTTLLLPETNQISALYQSILESMFLSGIGFVMFVMAFILLLRGPNRYEGYLNRYVPVHIMLTFIYIVLLLITHATFAFSLSSINLYVTYVAIAVCISFDVYLEYSTRKYVASKKSIRDISINPSTPYANVMKLKDQLFNQLSGEVGIVDKHFNSTAMSNLYRLLPSDKDNIKSIKIVTSGGMLDSNFMTNYMDLKSELANSSTEVEIKIMKEADATEQHERFMFDERGAYKIPPFSIINKKSEHIIRMSPRDAKKRFDYLYQNSVKIENYPNFKNNA